MYKWVTVLTEPETLWFVDTQLVSVRVSDRWVSHWDVGERRGVKWGDVGRFGKHTHTHTMRHAYSVRFVWLTTTAAYKCPRSNTRPADKRETTKFLWACLFVCLSYLDIGNYQLEMEELPSQHLQFNDSSGLQIIPPIQSVTIWSVEIKSISHQSVKCAFSQLRVAIAVLPISEWECKTMITVEMGQESIIKPPSPPLPAIINSEP